MLPVALSAGPPPVSAPAKTKKRYRINVNVNLAVFHVTVLDKHGRKVNDLTKSDFRVYEDNVPQTISFFSHADVPVTMGIIIDDSASMRDKRPQVDAAALTFVETSNPQDQVFVVNFNDSYYLDTPGDFASNMEQLQAAISRIDARGGTALYDTLYASLDHLRLGNRSKKVLLVITDGEDDASRYTLAELLHHAEKMNAEIYCVGLLQGAEDRHSLFHLLPGDPDARHAAKALKLIAQATGGKAYFPRTLDEVKATCVQIAKDIRNQYTIGYYPTNSAEDGTFRYVRIEAYARRTGSRLVVRTKPGYYAPKAPSNSINASSAR